MASISGKWFFHFYPIISLEPPGPGLNPGTQVVETSENYKYLY